MKLSWAGITSALFIALLPFFSLSTVLYPGVNAKFFLVTFWAALLLAGTGYIWWKGSKELSARGRWLLLALGSVISVEWIAMFFGVFPEHSFWSNIFWSSGVFFLSCVAVIAAVLGELLSSKDWQLLRRLIVVSGGVFGLLSLFGVLGFGYTGNVLGVRLSETGLSLGNETYAGAYLLLSFIIGAIELVRSKAGQWRVLTILSLGAIALSPLLFNSSILWGATPLTAVLANPAELLGAARASSAALLSILGFLAGHALIRRFAIPSKKEIVSRVWSLLVLIGLTVSIVLAATPGNTLHEVYVRESSAARPIVWNAAIEPLMERPVLGWGPENFQYAFQQNIDTRLFLKENLGEIWFERAHNVFIDTLSNVGVVGLLAYTLLIVVYLITIQRARRRDAIGEWEMLILSALPFAHLLQMQTGFDTIATYTMLGIVGGYVLSLERSIVEKRSIARGTRKAAAAVAFLVAFAVFWLSFGEYTRQTAILDTLRSTSSAEQKQLIEEALSRSSDFESLRILSSSFIKGALASIGEAPSEQKIKVVQEFLSQYELHLEKAIYAMPNDYRTHVNYAYLLLVKTGLGENRVEDAKRILEKSYALSPGNPITYILDSVAELYRGDLAEADRLMALALEIDPNVPITQEAEAYLERQKATFPNISVLRFTNL